jgi:hypothetical protein
MGDSGGSLWSMKTKSRQPWWSYLPDDELLQMRLKDLHVSIEGTWMQGCVSTLNGELGRRGLVQAHAWISDEWFSPDTTPGIAVPFYLAHPRLARLERKMFKDVEGGTRRQCMQILRHEAGHIVQHAYALHRRRKWQDMFGRSSTPYPESYRPNPTSHDHVHHLPRWYAQSHPDEDFAETFAVWLTPRANWRQKYAEWPGALEKLEFVDKLMGEIAGTKAGLTRRMVVDPVGRLNRTLAEHYEQKLAYYAVDTDTRYDRDLQRIFSSDPKHSHRPTASAFLRANRVRIRDAAWRISGAFHIALDNTIDNLISRARALKLRAPGREYELRNAMVRLLNNKVAHQLHASRRQWFAV